MRGLEHEGARRYLEQALVMIDRAGGSKGVNLREVARALGCAHTNAYNYFDSLEELLSGALVSALERQFAHLEDATPANETRGWGRLDSLIEHQVQFALEHSGWYRFVWLEPLTLPVPARATEIMEQAGATLIEAIAAASTRKLSPARARQLAEDFHNYLHGALCKAIAGRVEPGDARELRRRLVRSAKRVFRGMLEANGRG